MGMEMGTRVKKRKMKGEREVRKREGRGMKKREGNEMGKRVQKRKMKGKER